jgi:hypothetical protein
MDINYGNNNSMVFGRITKTNFNAGGNRGTDNNSTSPKNNTSTVSNGRP